MLSPERELSNILGAQQRQQHKAEEKTYLVYSSRCGRVRLHNVSVRNRGVDWKHPDNCYWQHQVGSLEANCNRCAVARCGAVQSLTVVGVLLTGGLQPTFQSMCTV